MLSKMVVVDPIGPVSLRIHLLSEYFSIRVNILQESSEIHLNGSEGLKSDTVNPAWP